MAARRSLLAMSLLGLSLALTGCESMDPAYWIPDNKKKLPGDRREVFPEGVPGVVQGVPPELIKGNNALMEPEPAPQAAAPQAAPPVEEKPKPKARPRKAARPAPPPEESQPQQRAQPAPAAPRPAQPAASGAWPSPQPQTAQQPQAAPSASGWPAPPPSGTFTR